MTGEKKKFRSSAWFGGTDRDGFVHRSWMKNQGLPGDLFDGRPVIGICNTFSELTPCNAHFRKLADHVKRGVYESGGFPVEFPVMSLGETNLRPTAMLFRNLASMDVEESTVSSCWWAATRPPRRSSWAPPAAISRPSRSPAGRC